MTLRIKQRKISELNPYANNARVHTEEQIQQIANSITMFGMNVPVLIDAKSNVIAGHGRLDALRLLGHSTTPTIELNHLSDEQRRAFILADNKTAENAYWDDLLLSEELNLIADIDMIDMGFSEDEIDGLFGDDKPGDKNKTSTTMGDDRFLVLVECEHESDQTKLFNEMNQRGFEVTLMT